MRHAEFLVVTLVTATALFLVRPAMSCPACHPATEPATPAAASPPRAAVRALPPPVTHTIVFPISGMTCERCATSIRDVLVVERGVVDAQVSFAEGQATITYDPATTGPSALAVAIKQISHRREQGAFTAMIDDKTLPLGTARLAVSGMTCASCAKSIEASLKRVDGFRRASISVESGAVVIDYDPAKATPSTLILAVNSAGYSAKLATPMKQEVPPATKRG